MYSQNGSLFLESYRFRHTAIIGFVVFTMVHLMTTVSDLVYFKYAPLTSTDVERSFSR
jgi:hypothetical protein